MALEELARMPDPTTVFLVRHGQTDWVAKGIPGRLPDVPLNADGREQAARLAARIGTSRYARSTASPSNALAKTAAPLARALGLDVRTLPAAVELDFGEWVGQPIPALADDIRWQAFNSYRSLSPAPGGELMLEVQRRIVAAIVGIRTAHPGDAVAVFSHGDVIRSAVAYFAGVPLDLFLRHEIRPASISSVRFYDDALQILGVNDTGDIYA
jgi:broad specificity phosphatase PhoE